MVISKSEFMMFLKHPAWLWLKKYDKDKLPEPDEELQARFDEGFLFEEYAEKLFPGGIKLGYKNQGNFSATKYYSLPEITEAELANDDTQVVFQGRIEVDGLTAIFDVLERVDGKVFDLYEIKSSTSVKPEHIPDLAFQTIVMEKAGFSVRDLYVLHVNSEYVRKGSIDPAGLASKVRVTEEVRSIIDETLENIAEASRVIQSKKMPDPSPRYLKSGSLSEWLKIVSRVRGEFPPYSIYSLAGLTPQKIGLLEDRRVKVMTDIPEDFPLSEKQEKQVLSLRSGRPIIDREELKTFFSGLKFPLYFFDYETMSGVIPVFDGTRPYQQVPFQYSLHIKASPETELVHKDYLHTENSCPLPKLLERMREDFYSKEVSAGSGGSVVSWYKTFEMKRNEEMAIMYPEYSTFLADINDRMVDLMIPFAKGWFVDKDFLGSASLKAVLPVLVPKLSYKELNISHGGMAQRVWMKTVLDGENSQDKEKIMSDLRKYCALDTYAMYAIYERLLEFA